MSTYKSYRQLPALAGVCSMEDAMKPGLSVEECCSRVLMNWDSWRQQGLTQHRNWRPETYQAACRHWGIEPDPEVLAYATTYQTVRADLKALTGSA